MSYSTPLIRSFALIGLFCGGIASAYGALVTNPARLIEAIVTVQPIIVSDDNGANTATFFGDAVQQAAIETRIDSIWNQAGIDVNFLAPSAWNNTFANWGTGGSPNNNGQTRPGVTDLRKIVDTGKAAGVANDDPNVLNMYFVNIPPAFSFEELNPGNNFFKTGGFSFINGNGSAYSVADFLDNVPSPGNTEGIGNVVAHEIGHTLGLVHTNSLGFAEEDKNLLWSGDRQGQLINDVQIAIALDSNLVVTAVPVPGAVWLFGSALLTLFGVNRRAQAA
ncbi:MAG: hypothetical protein V3V31_02195 [Methylococcales bacterium]